MSLMLNGVNPAIGGVLIRGEKGTAKSTAVRALTGLLPELEVVSGCRFSCNPQRSDELCFECRESQLDLEHNTRQARLITLPLNATEDRVTGGIDFSSTIKNGKAVLQTGLLADAHRGILYVDEVNLLDDHIVDLILDTAASGRNVIEREGISISHQARFILIGTMNPEEGELRPQLLDRFGLCIEVAGSDDLDERVSLLTKREEFDSNPLKFCSKFSDESERIRKQIVQGRAQLSKVRVPPYMRIFISELCTENSVAGHRADLMMEQAAMALAALEGENEVRSDHIRRVAPMVLIHRTRDAQPPPPPEPPQTRNQENEDNSEQEESEDKQTEQDNTEATEEQGKPEQKEQGQEQAETNDEHNQSEDDGQEEQNPESEEQGQENSPKNSEDQVFEIGASFKVKKITTTKDRIARRGSGRRSRSRVSQKQGRYSRASSNGVQGDIAMDATIRAAAPYQLGRSGNLAVRLTSDDFRFKIREKRIGNLLLFLVDASGSMGARGRMAASKGAVMSLLLDAYQKRDKVSMVTFRRNEAGVNLPITNSVELAGKLLAEMPVGGRTPLSAGLVKGYEQMRNFLIREPTGKPIVIILTDGKGNVSLGDDKPVDEMLKLAAAMAGESRAKYIVVDTEEDGLVTFDLARKLAGALDGDYFKIKDMQAEELVNIVREKQ